MAGISNGILRASLVVVGGDIVRGLVNRYNGVIVGGKVLDLVGTQDLTVVGSLSDTGGRIALPGDTSNYLTRSGHTAQTLTLGTLWMQTRAAPAGTTPSRALNLSDNVIQLFIGGNASGLYDDEAIDFTITTPTVANVRIRYGLPSLGHDYLRDNIDHTVALRIDGVDNAIFIDGIKKSATFLIGNLTTPNFFLNGGGAAAMFIGVEKFQGILYGGAAFDFCCLDIHNVGLTDAEIAQKG